MMQVKELKPEVIKEIVERIVSIAQPEKIILFGSYAYGRPSEDSDADLLIVMKEIKSRIEIYTKIRKNLKGIRIPFDIIIVNSEEFDFYSRNWINSVITEAREKGIFLYGD